MVQQRQQQPQYQLEYEMETDVVREEHHLSVLVRVEVQMVRSAADHQEEASRPVMEALEGTVLLIQLILPKIFQKESYYVAEIDIITRR